MFFVFHIFMSYALLFAGSITHVSTIARPWAANRASEQRWEYPIGRPIFSSGPPASTFCGLSATAATSLSSRGSLSVAIKFGLRHMRRNLSTSQDAWFCSALALPLVIWLPTSPSHLNLNFFFFCYCTSTCTPSTFLSSQKWTCTTAADPV